MAAITPAIGTGPSRDRVAAAIAEIGLICAGSGLIILAVLCDRQWLDRHVLPHMFLSAEQQTLWWAIERAAAFAGGLALALVVRPWAGGVIRRGEGRKLAVDAVRVALAVASSGLVSEIVLREVHLYKIDRWPRAEEPLRRQDTHFGWSNVPARTGVEEFYGRHIEYHIDAAGHSIDGNAIDHSRPTILFTGESIMLGFRLNWPETIAGRIQKVTGVQSGNLAVNGYSTDQAFMALTAELLRFVKPIAVIALFAPNLLDRNLDDDRPHLDTALTWHPAWRYWRLQRLAKNIILYRDTQKIENGIQVTRAALRATVLAAHARHAAALILVPCFTPETPRERALRHRVLDDPALPYVLVPLNPRWRLAHDPHPDARANLAMARAVIAGLRQQRPDIFIEPRVARATGR